MKQPLRDRFIGDLFEGPVWTSSSPVDEREDDLLPEERALVRGATPKRRREFAAGRRCAREVLARLGHPGVPLLRNADRSPQWPPGIVGSISHSGALCVAAIAQRVCFAGLGIDVESGAELAQRVWRRICTPAELEELERMAPPSERGRIARLVFSAKEATYKAVHPLVGAGFGFQDVEIRIDRERRRFEPRLVDSIAAQLPAGHVLDGRFARQDAFVFTAVSIPALRISTRA